MTTETAAAPAPKPRRHRGRRALVVVIVIVLLLAIAAIVLEIVARQQADVAIAKAQKSLPSGSTVTLDSSPVLWQLATGGARVSLHLDDAALEQLVRERSGADQLTVTTGTNRVTVSLPVTALGVSVPLAASFRPSVVDDALELDVATITIGGLTVSGDDARTALEQVGGKAATLLDTQRIPDDGSVIVDDASVDDEGATIDARVPLSTVLNGSPSLG